MGESNPSFPPWKGGVLADRRTEHFQTKHYYTSTNLACQALSGVGDKNRTCFHGFAIQYPSNWFHLHNLASHERFELPTCGVEDHCSIHWANATNLVLRVGVEPTHPKISDFKSLAATYYAIGAVKPLEIFLLCSSLTYYTSTNLACQWWADCELNTDSIDYESTALPLSYQPNIWRRVRESNPVTILL